MKPPAGFTPIRDLPFEIGAKRPLFNTPTTRLELYGKGKNLWGVVKFDENFTGPPKHAHGGAQAYVLDEVMGTVCWNAGVPVVAQSIEIKLKQPVPLHRDLVLTAQVGRKSGKVILVKAALKDGDKVLAIGLGRFHVLSFQKISTILGGKTPTYLARWYPKEFQTQSRD